MKYPRITNKRKDFFRKLYEFCLEEGASIEEAEVWFYEENKDEIHSFEVTIGCAATVIKANPIVDEEESVDERPSVFFDNNDKNKPGKWQKGELLTSLEVPA